ncbi:GLI pathogenesis-related 2 isoform X2 [Scleropages formosus]|nr:uncharacterized protein LOC108922633 isoform X2 [Scleropages formosus]
MADSSFEKEFLESHNSYRQKHGAPPLKMSRDLCSSAQAWADRLLSMQKLRHSDTENGENLFYTKSSVPKKVTGKEAVDNWYSEIKKYNFSRPGFVSGTGHFTQVVWKDSKEVGVGLATDGNTTVVVGQYHPAGNITNTGYFEKNVLPPGGEESRADEPPKESENKPSSTYQTTDNPDGQSSASSSFEKEFLESHNSYRQKHGAPPLKMSRDLCSSAQAWADRLLSMRTLQHSNTENGENLFYTQSSVPKKVTGKEAVDNWYSEIKKYNFSRPGFVSGTGHFTQVVWKDSKEVGVGLATDGNTTVVVGQYHPAGNITNTGYFEKNVLPPGGEESRADEPPKESENKPSSTYQTTDNPDGQSSASSSFEKEFLESHNSYRQKHGAPPLKMSRDLCSSAQAWADRLLSMRTLQHSNTENGENLFYTQSSVPKKVTGKEAVDNWYSEIKKYNFSRPGFVSGTGHFTQVVWKDSKEVGVGLATDGKTTFVVGQYHPAGNITNKGNFEKNVLPPGSSSADNELQFEKTPAPSKQSTPHPADPRTAPPQSNIEENQTTSDPDAEIFARDFLQACNKYRFTHGAAPLVLSPTINREAQDWADKLLKESTLKHSNSKHGESIWAKTGPPSITATGQEVVDTWYKEADNYDYSRSGVQSKTEHFTQLVWRSSKEVGVGRANNGEGKVIIVAQFEPAGNITNPGFYVRNVLPKGSKVTDKPPEKETKAVPLPDKELEHFIQSLLKEQNQYRKQHGAQPLVQSAALSKEAQDWAIHLVGIQILKNTDKQYGQNMWYRCGSNKATPEGLEVAESWYKESAKYSFDSPGFKTGTGNFTQMVWKSSEKVGIGLATDGNGQFICVEFFDPPGNITNPGYFRDNVLAKVSREL